MIPSSSSLLYDCLPSVLDRLPRLSRGLAEYALWKSVSESSVVLVIPGVLSAGVVGVT